MLWHKRRLALEWWAGRLAEMMSRKNTAAESFLFKPPLRPRHAIKPPGGRRRLWVHMPPTHWSKAEERRRKWRHLSQSQFSTLVLILHPTPISTPNDSIVDPRCRYWYRLFPGTVRRAYLVNCPHKLFNTLACHAFMLSKRYKTTTTLA